MKSYAWDTFTVKIRLNIPVVQAYSYWATPHGLEQWFLRAAHFANPDGTACPSDHLLQEADQYKWLWYGFGDEVAEYGQILKANGTDIFSFTFSGPCMVTVQLVAEGSSTLCRLTQSNIPTDEKGKALYHVGCITGWTFYLTNLKSVSEGGLDLRNRDTLLFNVVNA